MNWITLEVFDCATSAASWARAWHDRLIEAAVTGGAAFWDEHEHRWGVVLEFVFADERQRDTFRQAPVVLAALDAAPDPVNGVLVYPHRGGGSGTRQPRWAEPLTGSGSAALPEPDPDAERVVPCTTYLPDDYRPDERTAAQWRHRRAGLVDRYGAPAETSSPADS